MGVTKSHIVTAAVTDCGGCCTAATADSLFKSREKIHLLIKKLH